MKLVIGLGNPGKKYQYTRHNLGFLVLNKITGSKSWHKDLKTISEYKSQDGVFYVKPQTFMNSSGKTVLKFTKRKNINPDDLLIIRDDIDLEFGKIRFKIKSSAGGHKGVQSILDNLGVKEIAQLKIGIGQNEEVDLDQYVLANFTGAEKKELPKILDQAIEVVLELISPK